MDIKKLLKKAQSDPKTMQMLNNLKQTVMAGQCDQNADARSKLKNKMKQMRQMRGGKRALMHHDEKQHNAAKQHNAEKPSVDEVKVDHAATETLNDIETLKKAHNLKLRKLQRKYGTISLEQYTDALGNVNNEKLSVEQQRHHQNIIDLYLKQNPCQTEQMVVDEMDETDDPLVDLEQC